LAAEEARLQADQAVGLGLTDPRLQAHAAFLKARLSESRERFEEARRGYHRVAVMLGLPRLESSYTLAARNTACTVKQGLSADWEPLVATLPTEPPYSLPALALTKWAGIAALKGGALDPAEGLVEVAVEAAAPWRRETIIMGFCVAQMLEGSGRTAEAQMAASIASENARRCGMRHVDRIGRAIVGDV
jgi:hypothetical protein